MTRPTIFACVALLFASAGAAVLASACNTADVREAAIQDSGDGLCPTTAPVLAEGCDASAVTVGCTPDPDSGIAAITDLAQATYPLKCKVTTSAINPTTGECDITKQCTCAPSAASDAGTDGGASGAWICL